MDKAAMVLELFRAVSLRKSSDVKKLTKALVGEKPTDLLLTAVSSESEKNTILHLASKFGCNDLVDAILTSSLSPLVNDKNIRDNTPIHYAAALGHVHVVTSLIRHAQKTDQEKGTSGDLQAMLRARNGQDNTPLHEAARGGHGIIVEMLLGTLDATFLDEALMEVNKAGETPPSLAIRAKSSSTVEAILKSKPNISFELSGPSNQTMLHMTVMKRDLATMEVIFKNQSELAKQKQLAKLTDSLGRTPLHYAAAIGDTKLVQSLLKHEVAAAYIYDKDQMLPLHLAVVNHDNFTVVRELYESSPSTLEFCNEKRQNALHMAAEKGNIYMVAYLLTLPEIEELINSADIDENTPLNLSINNGYTDVVCYLFEDPRINLRLIGRETIRDVLRQVHETTTSSGKKLRVALPEILH